MNTSQDLPVRPVARSSWHINFTLCAPVANIGAFSRSGEMVQNVMKRIGKLGKLRLCLMRRWLKHAGFYRVRNDLDYEIWLSTFSKKRVEIMKRRVWRR